MAEPGPTGNEPDKDFVVKEMDVYICNNLAPKLHVFQFPPGFQPLSTDKHNLLGVKVKMESKRFMMDVKIDTRSRNFDRGKSEQIAFHANNGDEPYFLGKYMNKMILKSFESKPSNLQYAVGLIKHDTNELHLTPVNSVIQFRPSFDYFDKKEKKPPTNTSGPSTSKVVDHSPPPVPEEKKEEEIKRILMRFERPDEERIKKARESSYTYMRQKIANEPWVDVIVNHKDSGIANLERQQLAYHKPNDEYSYINGVNNPDVLMAGDDEFVDNPNGNQLSPVEEYLKPFHLSDTSTCIASLNRVKFITLNTKVHSIMMNAKVASFNDIKELLSDVTDDEALIRSLTQYALVVRGNWVVKSEILHSKESNSKISPLTGIPIELLCRARDIILGKFTQEQSLVREDLLKETKIPSAEVHNILKEISKLNRTSKKWDFILSQDDSFIKSFPDVIDYQNRLWKARVSQLERSLSTPSPAPKAKKARKATTTPCK